MPIKRYSDIQIHAFYEEYQSLKTCALSEFARVRELSIHSLRRGFNRLNLKIISQEITKRKYPVDDDFFSSINTEEKAYYLGFLFADGCNHGTKIEISLARQDKVILERLSQLLLHGNINIWEYVSKNRARQNKVVLCVSSKKICSDLEKLGCVPKKTFVIKFPKIPKNMLNHFIRGYFDGDGCLSFCRRKTRRTLAAYFSIVSTKEMLQTIGQHIENLGVTYKIKKRHKEIKNNNFTLWVQGNKQIAKVCDFLYKNASIFLPRKFEAYQKLLEMNYVNQR